MKLHSIQPNFILTFACMLLCKEVTTSLEKTNAPKRKVSNSDTEHQ